ncbi:MAG: glycoside hydrolase family 127 protein [Verrucomicrobia bacterium]|nr:glycoside hydrolase family 127 protein [Verrucomicrobiota bacterium]
MKPSRLALVVFLGATLPALAGTPAAFVVDHSRSPHTVLRPLPFEAVQWTNGFWAERYRQLVEVTLDESWRLLADPARGHVLDNFRVAARPEEGAFVGVAWQDEWLYKWLEAAASVWTSTRDPVLERRMDEAVALIAAAQEADGYLSTNITAKRAPRFQRAQDHELYNLGHLILAGVVHHRLTGKNNLLPVAVRAADYACRTVGVTVKPSFAHNPSILMGLVELYRLTGQRRYLECAQLIVDRRGAEPRKQPLWAMQPDIHGTDFIQDRVPVRDSREIVGHNVFFTYLYTGTGDLLAETPDPKLAGALDRLWTDLTQRRMFIHGGVSAIPVGLSNNAPVVEGAGAPYQLPNATCYNETCGQIGVFLWGYRRLALRPEAAIADVMEREMYNGILACLGLAGKSWFYRAILRRYDADYQSAGWTDMALRGQPGHNQICCPSNLLRTIAQLSAYLYSQDAAGLWVHHYGGSRVKLTLGAGETLACEQVTDYPWSGEVQFVLGEAPARPVAFRLRIPGWAGKAALAVNGTAVEPEAIVNGYATVTRTWRQGDRLALSLPCAPRLVTADPRVEEVRNQVAVMRGPVLYCVESRDLPPGTEVPAVFVPSDIRLTPEKGLPGSPEALAHSTVILRGGGLRRPDPRGGDLYRSAPAGAFETFDLRLVPYFAWANRGRSAMSVWLPVVWREGVSR